MLLVLRSLPLKPPENERDRRLRFKNGRGPSDWPKTPSRRFFFAVISYRRRKILISLSNPFSVKAIFFILL